MSFQAYDLAKPWGDHGNDGAIILDTCTGLPLPMRRFEDVEEADAFVEWARGAIREANPGHGMSQLVGHRAEYWRERWAEEHRQCAGGTACEHNVMCPAKARLESDAPIGGS